MNHFQKIKIILLTVFTLFGVAQRATAGSDTYSYFVRARVSATGQGLVYIGTNENGTPSAEQMDAKDSKNSNSTPEAITLHAIATASDGYEVAGWGSTSGSTDLSTRSTYSFTPTWAKQDTPSSPTATYYATFRAKPFIRLTPASLSLTSTAGYASAATSYTVYGINLTDNVTLSVGSVFEISSDGESWSTSVSINKSLATAGSGTTAYVRVKASTAGGSYTGTITASSTNAISKTISLNATTYNPGIYISPSSLAAFDYIGSGPSAAQAVTVDGYGLSENITVAFTGTGFQIATSESGPWNTSATLTISNKEYHGTLYVRLQAGLDPGNYSGSIGFTSGTHTIGISNLIGSVVSAKAVTIDDREDHNWTYYSGVDATVDGGNYNTNYNGIIYSPNPRNVKITYNGVTVDGGSAVAISGLASEDEAAMIYLKTLEQGSTEGEYPYTVIANPFSKRPKKGSTYYGFAGWKIISGGNYIKGHNNGDVLGLEADIVFENLPYPEINCTSAEIVFETTWTPATVKTGNSVQTFTGGTYETNFWVITGNVSGISDYASNATITMMTPDGGATNDYYTTNSYKLSSGISMSSSNTGTMKLEWVRLNTTSSIEAHGRNLYIGRGITNAASTTANSGSTIYGSNSSNATVNQVIRVESGVYRRFYNYGASVSNFTKQIVYFGCDYDRANNNNNNLDIKGICKISSSTTLGFNHTDMMTRTYSKSGKIMSGISVADAATDNVYYYAPDGSDQNYQGGCRYLEIEGGEWCCIAGGFDNFHSSTDMAFTFRMRGGLLRGSIYGAGEFYGASGCRRYILTGGQIKGWVAAGANGTRSSGGETIGTSYVYVGGNARVDSEGNNDVINRGLGGNVFGAGCGYDASSSSGEMSEGTNVVVADNCYVEHGVYGGGSYGFTTATSNIYVTGGHVGGKVGGVNGTSYDSSITGGVFGGACQNKGGSANIYMTGGLVEGGVYGGSNSNGTLSGSVNITIHGGQVGTSEHHANVHGGGYGANTIVEQNVTLNIGKVYTTGATFYGDIYGGSALGKVNGSTANTTFRTAVTFTNGILNGNLYGGALGNSSNAAAVYSPVTVTVDGGTINGSVFGCNNVNGAPQRAVTVNVTGGTINHSVYGGANQATYSYGTGPVVNVSGGKILENVFGAGYGADATVSGNTTVNISGTANIGNNIYGGGENGDVGGNTTVTINGQETKLIVNSVYGAGYGTASNVTGSTTVNIYDGKINGSVFGGGEMGHADSYTTVTMTGGRVAGDIHGGAQGISGQDVLVGGLKTVNITGGTVETSVYGGSRSVNDTHPSGNNYSSFVNISGGTIDRNVYGGGFYGTIEGSVAVLIGKNVIDNHNTLKTYNVKRGTHTISPLVIIGNIYAGSNWGDFSGGAFGGSNISGRSDIFVDGTNYDMTYDHGYAGNYMVINKSIYGAGTSTDAGAQGRKIVINKYGLPTTETMTITTEDGTETQEVLSSSTRWLRSIQRCDELVIADSHIDFKGQGDMTSNITTEIYSIINVFEEMRMVNGSSVIISYPIDNIKKLESSKVLASSLYVANPSYVVVNTNDDGQLAINGNTGNAVDNKFRINEGTFLNVRYKNATQYLYGELSGFFHIITANDNSKSFAYARIKVTDNESENKNVGDGGFLSYFESINNFTDEGSQYTQGLQHPYTNQLATREDTRQFRYWSIQLDENSNESNREGVFIAQTNTSGNRYLTTDCVISLPAACSEDSYYVISYYDWGVDVFACDTAATDVNATTYMDWHSIEGDQLGGFTTGITTLANNQIRDIDRNKNLSFGIVAIPSGGLSGNTMLLSDNSLELVQNTHMSISNIEERTELLLRLTYSNDLTLNNSLSPFFITIDQYCDGQLHDRTNAEIIITTATHIPQDLNTEIYDLAFGDGPNPYDYTRTITLPIFDMFGGNIYNVFKVTNIVNITGGLLVSNGTTVTDATSMTMLFGAADNPDDQNGWLEPEHELIDVIGATLPYTLGTADGRSMFSIDFTLIFDGTFDGEGYTNNQNLGNVVFTVKQYAQNGTTELSSFDITINIILRNQRISWFIDGVNGYNRYSGHYPNAAKRTLGGVYNDGYVPGDNIYAVNQTDIKYTSEWSSRAYNSVTIRRYNGGAELFTGTEDYYAEYTTDYNPNNERYAGTILYLDGGIFSLKGIILDGSNDLTAGSSTPGSKETVSAVMPLVYLQSEGGNHEGNGTFVMTNRSVLQNNTNIGTHAGGVFVASGTECIILGGSQIIDNIVSGENKANNEGGGVYVECGGKLTVAQKVTITDNTAHSVENNVYLQGGCAEDLTITVGYEVDEVMTGLTEDSKIGVTKEMAEGEYYTPIVYSTRPSYIDNADKMFFDDRTFYDVIYWPEEPFKTYHAYFIDTWVSHVRTEPEGWSLSNIDSAEDLAWLISYVNGYNGSAAHPNAVATLTADVDMSAYVWVPIGASSTIPFTGKFDGQAHTIDGVFAPFKVTETLGLFGYAEGAEIKGVFVTSCDFEASPEYLGVVVGELRNSDLYYSEGAGTLKGGPTTLAVGGLVGLVDYSDVHSSMAMTTIEGDCNLGGLVGEMSNESTLKNSFSNGIYKFTGTTAKYVGGLVGKNSGTIDNCYIRSLRTGSSLGTATFRSFSGNNTSVTHCYDASNYTATSTPYMYKHKDNMIGTHAMTDTLNKFVSGTLAPWMRSSAGSINDDYPVLKLPYNAMGSEDNIVLKYGTLSNMITRANAAEGGATLFQYRDEDIEGATTDSDVTIYIQEDASLLHTSNNISAYVGITVGNNSTSPVYGHDGVQQSADWHIISSSLKDAPLGVNYGDDNTQYAYWDDPESSALPHFPFYEESVKDGYFPSREFGKEYEDDEYPYTYDFYHFYEPQYHWINFKRNSASHYHEDGTHLPISYTNEETLLPGRGYLISIDTTTFMQAHGHLNSGTITTPVTTSGYYLTGCNMIGNPYQSYLNFNAFANENSSLWAGESPSYIVFDAVEGGYVQYTVDSKGTGVSKGAKAAGQYLHPHQGFYIIANSAGNATFKNEMRAFNPGGVNFRGEEQPEYPLINVVASDTLNHKEFAVVEFDRPVLDGCDKNDYIYEGNYKVYFHNDSRDYGILFIEKPTDHVALFFEALEENEYTLTFSTANAEYTYLHLIDNLTGINVDLLANDTYTFHAKPSDYKARFKIIFSYTYNGIEEDSEGYDDFMFFNGSEWVVEGEGNLRVVDITGRTIYVDELHSSHNVVTLPRVAAGVYMVELRNNATHSTQKIVIR